MTRYFSADLHLGHANIIKYCDRPWASVEEMHKGITERWNDTVGDHDEVIILGDLSMGKARWAQTCEVVKALKGRKLLLPGNHDECWPPRSKAGLWCGRYENEAGLYTVMPIHRVRNFPLGLDAEEVVWVDLAHFPYRDDHPDNPFPDDRHKEYWPKDHGRWLLHGHIHGAAGKVWPAARQIDVGMDCWDWTPVSEGQVLEVIARAS